MPPTQSVEKLSCMKPVRGAKKRFGAADLNKSGVVLIDTIFMTRELSSYNQEKL